MVRQDNPLFDALETLLTQVEEANPDWWQTVGLQSERGDKIAQAWERINNVRNGMKCSND